MGRDGASVTRIEFLEPKGKNKVVSTRGLTFNLGSSLKKKKKEERRDPYEVKIKSLSIYGSLGLSFMHVKRTSLLHYLVLSVNASKVSS